MALSTDKGEYWVAWLRYSRKDDGCMTHAVPSDSTRALCGVVPTEYGGTSIAAQPVGCKRCNAVLRRLGVTS